MPDKSEFSFHIKSTADLAAMNAAKASLEGQRQALAQMGKDTAEVDDKINKLQQRIIQNQLAGMTGKSAEGVKEVGDAAEKATEKTGEFLEGHHGIHAIGHALNNAVPGLMQFTRFLTSGFTGAIGATLLAFEYLNSKIEQFDKLIENLDTGSGARGGWAEKLKENVKDAAVEEAVFNEKLRETAERQRTLEEATNTLIEAQKRQSSATKAVADAQQELDIARLDLAEKLGQIGHEEAVKIRLQIDEEGFKRQLEEEKAAIKAELEARQNELNANNRREPGLGGAVDRTSAAALAAKNAQDKNAEKLSQDKADLEQLQEAQKKMQEGVNLGDFMPRWLAKFAQQGSPVDILENGPDQLAAMVAQKQRAVKQEEGKDTALSEAAAVAKEQADKAKSDYEDAAKLSEETLKTVQKLKADLAAATAKNEALERIHNQTAETRAATQNAPQTEAANQVLMRRAMSPDRGVAETAAEQSGFNTLSQNAENAMRNADLQLRHHGVGATGNPSIQELVAIVQQLTSFLKEHPALNGNARDDMQSQIDEIRRDLSDMASRQSMSRQY